VLEPPDLKRVFGSERERGRALAEFLLACLALDDWQTVAFSRRPLPQDRRALLQSAEPGDSPELKLGRWVALYEDELIAVFESRNRIEHGLRISDGELRGAHWLATHLLELLQPVAVT